MFTFIEAFGRLTEAPRSNFIFEGSTAEFTCCSDIQSLLFWEVKSVGSQSTSDINDIYGLINGFRKFGRFNITDGNRPGCYKLTIRDVKQDNAGTYTCIDDEGLGQTLSWELVIIGKNGQSQVTNIDFSLLGILCYWLQSAQCTVKN